MKLVDLKELSEIISLSVFTLRKYVKMGLPHYRVGRKILVDLEEFEAWFQQFKKADSTYKNDSLTYLVDAAVRKYR